MSNDPKNPQKPAPQPEATLSISARELKEALAGAIAEGMTMATMAAKGPVPPPTPAQVLQGEKCEVCKQLIRGCKKEHRKAVVHPEREENARFFRGVAINGVWYRSNHPGHKIDVPKDCNVEYLVAVWEDTEMHLSRPRHKEHNSGSTQNFQSFNGMGFR